MTPSPGNTKHRKLDGMLRTVCCAIGAAVLLAGPAQAVTVCAWIDETLGEDDYRELKLWLEADGPADVYYMIKGEGLSAEGMKAHSPSSGTLVLHPKTPNSPWTFGVTLVPPGKVDVVAEVRAWPKDVFAEEPPPLLAAFTFRRDVPEGETAPPKVFAAKPCAAVTLPPSRESNRRFT